MKPIIFLLPLLVVLAACDDDSADADRISDAEALEELDIINVITNEKDLVYFQNQGDDLYVIAEFRQEEDVSVIVEEQEFELNLEPAEDDFGEEVYADIAYLGDLPIEPGDEVEYEVELSDIIFEGDLQIVNDLEVNFPDTLKPDESFTFDWEIEEDPQSFFNIFIAGTEEEVDDLALVWLLGGNAREAEFDVAADFDIDYPEILIEPAMLMWAANFDNFAPDGLAVMSQDIRETIYDYSEDDFEGEELMIERFSAHPQSESVFRDGRIESVVVE